MQQRTAMKAKDKKRIMVNLMVDLLHEAYYSKVTTLEERIKQDNLCQQGIGHLIFNILNTMAEEHESTELTRLQYYNTLNQFELKQLQKVVVGYAYMSKLEFMVAIDIEINRLQITKQCCGKKFKKKTIKYVQKSAKNAINKGKA